MENNQKIAKIFYEISEILKLKNVQWKPQAYNKAARVIEDLDQDVKEIYKKEGLKGLDKIPGVGKSMAKKIEEFLKTGKIKAYIKLKKSIPKGLVKLMEIEGIGPKKAKQLYEKLKIKDIKDLQRAVKKGKIKKLERFGEKSEKDIEESIKTFKARSKKRLLLGKALPISEAIINELKNNGIKRIIVCGSIRRMYETIGDIDLLATSSKPSKVVEAFTKLKEVKRILAKGNTKGMVLLENNLHADIRVVKDEVFGSALQYFTGCKDHSIKVRQIAIKKGLKLSEYGLFNKKTNKRVAVKEEDIYKKLGMQFIPAELRENKGEVEAALKNKIPRLINYNDIRGDLHVHTKASDGMNTIKEMAEAAKKLNYSYIGVADHSKTRKISGGLSNERLNKQIKEVRKTKVKGIKILSGNEVDILGDGSLDYSDNLLKKLDFVIAAIHSGFRGNVTKRILKAMENKNVNIIAHPTGRLIGKRSESKINFDEICRVARERKILLEINAHQERLDLRDELIKRAIENKVKLIINTDAHSIEGLRFMRLGIGQARRGWVRKADIVNTNNLDGLKKFLR